MDGKEAIRRELSIILKIDEKANYSDKKYLDSVIAFISKEQINHSPYGKKFENIVKSIASDKSTDTNHLTCFICKKESGKKLICSACRSKLNGATAKPQQTDRTVETDKQEKMVNPGNVVNSVNTVLSSGIKNIASPNTEQAIRNTASALSEQTKKTVDKITERVNVMLGGEGKVDLKLKDLFSQVFTKHSKEEADELFICGTKYTTPTPDKISTSWPKPWLFSRVAIVLIATFCILLSCYNVFKNEYAIPGIMFIGSLAIPFSMLIFLFEINAPRNISIYQVVYVFMMGGAASLFVTLVLYQFNSSVTLSIGGAIFVGIVEELGKILILAYIMNRLQTTKYILNGLLIGGSVGAGFAVFESAGYAFSAYIGGKLYGLFSIQTSSSVDNMVTNILLRGFLSPGGHIAWAAMEGAFLVIVLAGRKFEWSQIWSPQFLGLCLLPVGMHALWDMPILNFAIGYISGKMLLLEILALIVILVILSRGLWQINTLQTNAEN